MAQEKTTVDQILKLVQTLSPEERGELQRRLDASTWGDQWDQLSSKIQARFAAANEPIPTEEEVMAEVKAVREERKARRAQGSN
jgi:uncharacterized coiled-coil DUF342 family protein